MAGNDMIHGEGGDDFILGQGADQLFGDDGEDDITGGHNVTFGVDEGDRIMGGEQADVSRGQRPDFGKSSAPSQCIRKRYPHHLPM